MFETESSFGCCRFRNVSLLPFFPQLQLCDPHARDRDLGWPILTLFCTTHYIPIGCVYLVQIAIHSVTTSASAECTFPVTHPASRLLLSCLPLLLAQRPGSQLRGRLPVLWPPPSPPQGFYMFARVLLEMFPTPSSGVSYLASLPGLFGSGPLLRSAVVLLCVIHWLSNVYRLNSWSIQKEGSHDTGRTALDRE